MKQSSLQFVVLLFHLLSLGLGLPVCAATTPPATEYTLKNGLRILIVERHESPTFSAHIRFRVGSADDPPGFTGLAHLVEHLMFKGTRLLGSTDPFAEEALLNRIDLAQQALEEARSAPTSGEESSRLRTLRQEQDRLESEARRFVVPNELWETYRRNGGANINAVTLRDSTQYFISLPKNRFELWAFLESDRLRSPVFREFASEQEVIQEEYRQMVETNPTTFLQVSAYQLAFSATPYRHPIWGWPADRHRITREKARDFAAAYYGPNNAWIVLVGDLDPSETIAVIKRYFGDLPARPLPPLPAWREPVQTEIRRVTVDFPAEPQVVLFFQAPPYGPETETLSLVASLLVNGRSSRLHKALVEEQRLATGVTSDTSWFLRQAGLFSILGLPRAPHTVGDVEAGILKEIGRLATSLIAPEELERVQNQAELVFAKEIGSNAGLAAQLARAWDLSGDWRTVFARQDRIRAIDRESIRQAVQRYLIPSRCTVGWMVRSAGAAAPAPPSAPAPVPFESGDPE
jgi:predicted Zn-dependent peptidase